MCSLDSILLRILSFFVRKKKNQLKTTAISQQLIVLGFYYLAHLAKAKHQNI